MEKICFVISPMGDPGTPTRKRADYVLRQFIEPACRATGYRAVRADHQEVENIVKGIDTALQNAPLTIAYLGAPHCGADTCAGTTYWNANVMIEVGIRAASRLPMILVCDPLPCGSTPDIPLNLKANYKITVLPPAGAGASPADAADVVTDLVARVRYATRRVRTLPCKHALASINAVTRDSDSPDVLLYTAASAEAELLFGVEADDGSGGRGARQLVGRTMTQFLAGVRERMHPVQWEMFHRDQAQARGSLKDGQTAVAGVPIVFETHENPDLNRRAFLPIIVQDYQPDQDGENNWYNLRVLYLNVTTATRKVLREDGTEYYACDLDPTYPGMLTPLKPFVGIRVFLSYARRNYDKVEAVLERLRELRPYVDPFIDLTITAGAPDLTELGRHLQQADLHLVFFDAQDLGPGQNVEVQVLTGWVMEGRKMTIVPVLLEDGAAIPPLLTRIERIGYDDLMAPDRLQQILVHHFPRRCPSEWAAVAAH